MQKLLIKSDLDILDMVDLDLSPVDRLGQADFIPFYPEIPISLVRKTIIVNRWFEGCQDLIQELSKQNKIINRVADYSQFEVQKYNIDNRLIISSSYSDKIAISEIQKSVDIRIILLDDLIITNKQLCLEWS